MVMRRKRRSRDDPASDTSSRPQRLAAHGAAARWAVVVGIVSVMMQTLKCWVMISPHLS
jgi:hypothetical protein